MKGHLQKGERWEGGGQRRIKNGGEEGQRQHWSVRGSEVRNLEQEQGFR